MPNQKHICLLPSGHESRQQVVARLCNMYYVYLDNRSVLVTCFTIKILAAGHIAWPPLRISAIVLWFQRQQMVCGILDWNLIWELFASYNKKLFSSWCCLRTYKAVGNCSKHDLKNAGILHPGMTPPAAKSTSSITPTLPSKRRMVLSSMSLFTMPEYTIVSQYHAQCTLCPAVKYRK